MLPLSPIQLHCTHMSEKSTSKTKWNAPSHYYSIYIYLIAFKCITIGSCIPLHKNTHLYLWHHSTFLKSMYWISSCSGYGMSITRMDKKWLMWPQITINIFDWSPFPNMQINLSVKWKMTSEFLPLRTVCRNVWFF